MAAVACTKVTLNDTTPVQIFNGPGTIIITQAGCGFYVGDATITAATGIFCPMNVPLEIGNENLFALSSCPTTDVWIMTIVPLGSTKTIPAVSSIASSAASVQLLAANAGRRCITIRNDSTSTLFLGRGAAATITSPIMIAPAASWMCPAPCYTGVINGIWSSANGFARIEEIL